MVHLIPTIASWLLLSLTLLASVYTLFAAWRVRRMDVNAPLPRGPVPAVTLLKPLYGAEPGLYENLASFCVQDYAAPIQILCGAHSRNDPAAGVVERIIRDFPTCDVQLVITAGCSAVANDKIANLIGIVQRASHAVLIMSDSDIAVGRDYVARSVAALAQPGAGLVTWLYRGVALGGVPARLARMAIDYHFLPSVLVGRALGLAHPCFGSTIALTRNTLKRIGGFEAFGQHLADDYAIGHAVRALGLNVTMPCGVLAHACTERTLRELLLHELRWARTVRAIDPAGYAGMVLTHPLPLALIYACSAQFAPLGLMMIAFALASRLVLKHQVDHTLRLDPDRAWLALIRDGLSFFIYVVSFFIRVVHWRGRAYRVQADGTLHPLRVTRT